MTKFALISDTHCQHRKLKIPAVDAILHAGDISYQGNLVELDVFNTWAGEFDSRFIMIPGNHDRLFERDPGLAKSVMSEVEVLNQQITEVDDLIIYGEPRQIEFFNWAFNVPREQMKQVWEKVPTNVDILLTHGPPWGGLSTNIDGTDCGCKYLRDWIEMYVPLLVVCGHIHEGRGWKLADNGKTLIVNASTLDHTYTRVRPPIIVDIEDRKVVSIDMGNGRIDPSDFHEEDYE